MSDATGVTSYAYDARDRLVSKGTPEGTLSYTYDAAGNRTTVRSDSGAYAVDYGYDALNRLSTVTDKHPDALAATAGAGQVTAYHYDLAGRLHDNVYPNGVATTWSYDDLGRITNITTARGATALASYTYGLGPTGNRRSVAELGGRSVTWDYDGLYRLTTETIAGAASANGVIGYAYDPVGNRLSRTSTVPGIAAQAFTYDADDRLNSDAWDANGNTLSSATSTYGYDSENRLVSLNASEAGYLYDGDGQLVRRTVGGVATTYLVDDQTPAGYTQTAEERVGGVVAKSYVFGPQRISMRSAEGLRWYAYDAHSGVRALLDSSVAVTDTHEYEAFGNVVARTGTTDNAFTCRGEQADATAGLHYLRARWMDPAKGRFQTRDPWAGRIGEPSTLGGYPYASENPTDASDPSGYDPGMGGGFDMSDVSLGPANRLLPHSTRVPDIAGSPSNLRFTIPYLFSWSPEVTLSLGPGPGSQPFTRAEQLAWEHTVVRGIERYWTGTFGRYSVVTRVAATSDASSIDFWLYQTLGGGGARTDPDTGSVRLPLGDFRYDPVDIAYVAAHEAGHTLGLRDAKDNRDEPYCSEPGFEWNIMSRGVVCDTSGSRLWSVPPNFLQPTEEDIRAIVARHVFGF